jgi:hypothetical protein
VNRDWIVAYLRQIARRDFYEFNAIPYTRYQLKALFALHDYSPDESARVAARGILNWLFAKHAVSGNLDRDHRPYRRRPEPQRFASIPWWGSAVTATTPELSILVGPVQHVHSDIDLQLDAGKDEDGKYVLTEVAFYPELGAASEDFLASAVDVVDTQYRLPGALSSWLDQRFSDEGTNRTTYVQAYRHGSNISDDPTLFKQLNGGAELVSGNRNWTMVAGGTPAGPGDPGPPPERAGAQRIYDTGGAVVGVVSGGALGGIVGPLLGATAPNIKAANQQHETLWKDQPSTVRETVMIPTPVGLDRSQTIRFGLPLITKEGAGQAARLCVAEGFMCGFDLHMPTRPFPAKDAAKCPMHVSLPAALANRFGDLVDGGQPDTWIGCLEKPSGEVHDWQTFSFERGMLAMSSTDAPGNQRLVAAWIENRPGDKRHLRVKWFIPGDAHDWFNVYNYNFLVQASFRDVPPGYLQFQEFGDANNLNKWTEGEAVFDLEGVQDAAWYLLIEACDPTYGILGIRTGHACHSALFPRLSLNVAPPPKQSFSCDAYFDERGHGIVMEVGGACSRSPYGVFIYVYSQPCSIDDECIEGASDFGFVVAAPSKGWTKEEFAALVSSSILDNFKLNGYGYRPNTVPVTIAVPISPPVLNLGPS